MQRGKVYSCLRLKAATVFENISPEEDHTRPFLPKDDSAVCENTPAKFPKLRRESGCIRGCTPSKWDETYKCVWRVVFDKREYSAYKSVSRTVCIPYAEDTAYLRAIKVEIPPL